MRAKSIITSAALALCAGVALAVPTPDGDPDLVEVLSDIQEAPNKSRLDEALGAAALSELLVIVEDANGTSDPGLRLRALHAIAHYIESPEVDQIALALRDVVTANEDQVSGTPLLYLRAAMLSLATVEGATSTDLLLPLLEHPSRDVRAASAHAIGESGDLSAAPVLRERFLVEPSEQVLLAISDALFSLEGN